MQLGDFIETYRESITRAVLNTYPPLYSAQTREQGNSDLTRLKRPPLGAQADTCRAVALSLRRQPGTILCGEMGTGKSYCGTAAAYLAGKKRSLIICPPHLVEKWQREVQATVEDARASIISDLGGLRSAVRQARQTGPHTRWFFILSREQAKLSYRWKPVWIERPAYYLGRGTAGGRKTPAREDTFLCCPRGYTPLLDKSEIPVDRVTLAAKKQRCSSCGEALWQADRTGPKRIALAEYIKKRLRGFFDLLLIDEAHEFKAHGSAQGWAVGALAQTIGCTLALTGTLFGGYSSSLFYLLYRCTPQLKREFGYGDEPKWVSRYGIVERVTKKAPDAYSSEGTQSKRRQYATRTIERPGVSPAVLFHLIDRSAFVRITDIASLAPYRETIALLPMAAEQEAAYRSLSAQLRSALFDALSSGSKRLLGAYLQSLLSYPDGCTREERVCDPGDGRPIAYAPGLAEEVRYPKEEALLALIRRNRTAGRRVLVYVSHTGVRDLTPRLAGLVGEAGFKATVLKSTTVNSKRRESWVEEQVRAGVEVLITQPRLVQTGLDLIDFPSIVFYEPEYSIYTMRQASRRSWRIGQRHPVEVSYLVYEGTLQARALALVASKMQAALLVEGELSAAGLSSFNAEGGNFLLDLARKLTEEQEVDETDEGEGEENLEALFARALETTRTAEEFLDPAALPGQALESPPVPDRVLPVPDAPVPPRTQPAQPERVTQHLSWDDFNQAVLARRARPRQSRPAPDLTQLALFAIQEAAPEQAPELSGQQEQLSLFS